MKLCLIFLLLSIKAFAQQEMTAQVIIIDKPYTKTTTQSIEVGKRFVFQSIEITVHDCKINEANQTFALTEFVKNQKTIFKKWIPIEEYNLFPYTDKRFDITIQDCIIPNNEEIIAKKA